MLNLQPTLRGELVVLTLPERLDVANVPEFIDATKSQIRAGNRKLVLNFAGTQAIDSTALGSIVQIYKWLRVGQGDLYLVGLSKGVLRVFAVTRLDRAFDIFDSVEAVEQRLSA